MISPRRRAGLSSEQHNKLNARVDLAGRLNEPIELIEVVEGGRGLLLAQEPHLARKRVEHAPLGSDLERHVECGEDVVRGGRLLLRHVRLQARDLFVGDGIEPLVAQQWPQVVAVRRQLAVDAARLVSVGSAVAVDEARPELRERRDVFRLLRR